MVNTTEGLEAHDELRKSVDELRRREKKLVAALKAQAIITYGDGTRCFCDVFEALNGRHQKHCEEARAVLAAINNHNHKIGGTNGD